MEEHSCRTYFSVKLQSDDAENNKEEVEKYIIETLGVEPEWRKHYFVIGSNEKYNVDVNKMIAITLKDLFGKEDKIKEMQNRFTVKTILEIVPFISTKSDKPKQILSLDKNTVDFLYNTDTVIDMDYYII